MHMLVAVLIVSVLWVCPVMGEAGTPGTPKPGLPETFRPETPGLPETFRPETPGTLGTPETPGLPGIFRPETPGLPGTPRPEMPGEQRPQQR
jgi:hypothetical protein